MDRLTDYILSIPNENCSCVLNSSSVIFIWSRSRRRVLSELCKTRKIRYGNINLLKKIYGDKFSSSSKKLKIRKTSKAIRVPVVLPHRKLTITSKKLVKLFEKNITWVFEQLLEQSTLINSNTVFLIQSRWIIY